MKKGIKYFGRTFLILLLSSFFSLWLERYGIGKENMLMVLMIGVLLVSACTEGYIYGVLASLISIMIFNYYFTVPLYSFSIIETKDIIMMGFFLGLSIIASTLTVRFQSQMKLAQKNERIAQRLYELSSNFASATGKENIIQLGIDFIHEHTGYNCEFIMDEEVQNSKREEVLDYEIIGLSKRIGVLRIHQKEIDSQDKIIIIKATCNQIGIALDREFVYQEQEKIKVEMEREHIRSSMLRSISHDFRTPLTGIMGDCSLLQSSELEKESVQQLAQDIDEQAVWLMKMMENILNLTKLESGKLTLSKEVEVVEDILYEAANHVIGLRTTRQFSVLLPEEVVTIETDGQLMIQVFTNLLDNAMRHTKNGDTIEIEVTTSQDAVQIRVRDNGEGIDEKLLPDLFDEFVTSAQGKSDHQRGIGLGLAICKAVVFAHGGEISAKNREEKGAEFTVILPKGANL